VSKRSLKMESSVQTCWDSKQTDFLTIEGSRGALYSCEIYLNTPLAEFAESDKFHEQKVLVPNPGIRKIASGFMKPTLYRGI